MERSERILLRNSFAYFRDEYMTNGDNVEEWFYATDALANYSLVLPFEATFNRAQFFMASHRIWPFSIIMSVTYVILAYWGQACMRHRESLQLQIPLVIWNIFMAIFSAIGCLRMTPEVYRALTTHSFLYSVCVSDYVKDPVVAFWVCMFVISKLFELADTIFVVLRKKPLTFLHCYHHASVLLYVWHAAKSGIASGRWFIWMNYGVHSFMYTYYAATSLRFQVPRWIRICLTTLQISQMAIAIIISYVVFKAKHDWQMPCFQTWSNLNFAISIYVTYFVLFSKFFYETYLKSGRQKKHDRIKEYTIGIKQKMI